MASAYSQFGVARNLHGTSSVVTGFSAFGNPSLTVVGKSGDVLFLPVTWFRPGAMNKTVVQSTPQSGPVTIAGTLAPADAASNPDPAIQATIPWSAVGTAAPSAQFEVPMQFECLRLTFGRNATMFIKGCP